MAEGGTTMPTKVEDFLDKFENQANKSISVEKAVDLIIDPGNLLASDVNEIEVKKFRKKREQVLLQLTRDNTQLLVNNISQLPVENSVIKLPEPTTVIPREKVVPKEKTLTKWEQYAKLKGIQKKKKGRMVWDSESKEYKPRWGFQRKDETKSWLLEVPENADPMEDQFAKKKKEKKERVAKNELQRLRNIARATKSKVPGVGLTPTVTPTKDHLSTALAVTHKSTASLGKFMDTLPKEKLKGLGKRRKFESNDNTDETEKQKKILKKITDATPVLDVNRAANATQQSEERQRAMSKDEDGERRKKAGSKTKGGRKLHGGKGKKSFGAKKSFGEKGKKGGGGGGKGGKKGRQK